MEQDFACSRSLLLFYVWVMRLHVPKLKKTQQNKPQTNTANLLAELCTGVNVTCW